MILETLSNAFGPSGCEDDVRTIVVHAIEDHVQDCRVDHLGNVLATMPGTSAGPVVMVTAHMDEVGLMVTHADDNGFLHFVTVGGVDQRVLPAKHVVVGNDRVPGVIAIKPVHKTSKDERKKVVSVSNLVIDVGATSKSEASKIADKGDYAAFATRFNDRGETVTGKAFDDRVGCALLVELIQRGPYPVTLRPVFTSMEEVGLRGARVAGFAVNPDAAFVLEGTICDDGPKDKDESPTSELGKGPVIGLADKTVISDPRLVKLVTGVAEREQIPFQFKQPGKGGTDAGAIHLARTGVPSLPVCVACRYIHSPVAVAGKKDIEQTADLMEAVLRAFTPDVLAERD